MTATFNAETSYSGDWQYMDTVKDATFTPGDAHGNDDTPHAVKVRWLDNETNPQYGGGQFPMSPTESSLVFWKGLATTAPDPEVDETIRVESVDYQISRVTNHRNGQFTLVVNESRTNRV